MPDWPNPVGGNDPAANWLNRLLAKCKEVAPAESPDIRLEPSSHGSRLLIRKRGGGGAPSSLALQLMRVRLVFDDVLLCYDEEQSANGTVNGAVTIGTTPRWVLKPYELRHSPFLGFTWGSIYYQAATPPDPQRRVARPGPGATGSREEQRIVPAYQVAAGVTGTQTQLGSQILAARDITGLAGSFTPPAGQPGAGVAQSLEWIDITPGRIWAEFSFTP